MPEVILLYPRVPHPHTDNLLHGEDRTDTETLNCYKKTGSFYCQIEEVL